MAELFDFRPSWEDEKTRKPGVARRFLLPLLGAGLGVTGVVAAGVGLFNKPSIEASPGGQVTVVVTQSGQIPPTPTGNTPIVSPTSTVPKLATSTTTAPTTPSAPVRSVSSSVGVVKPSASSVKRSPSTSRTSATAPASKPGGGGSRVVSLMVSCASATSLEVSGSGVLSVGGVSGVGRLVVDVGAGKVTIKALGVSPSISWRDRNGVCH